MTKTTSESSAAIEYSKDLYERLYSLRESIGKLRDQLRFQSDVDDADRLGMMVNQAIGIVYELTRELEYQDSAKSDVTTRIKDNPLLNLDVSAEEARALHRIVRAMHDGHCPQCGHLGDASTFIVDQRTEAERHECPKCGFTVFQHEAIAALRAFQPYLKRSLRLFKMWREGITEQDIVETAPDCSATHPAE